MCCVWLLPIFTICLYIIFDSGVMNLVAEAMRVKCNILHLLHCHYAALLCAALVHIIRLYLVCTYVCGLWRRASRTSLTISKETYFMYGMSGMHAKQ